MQYLHANNMKLIDYLLMLFEFFDYSLKATKLIKSSALPWNKFIN